MQDGEHKTDQGIKRCLQEFVRVSAHNVMSKIEAILSLLHDSQTKLNLMQHVAGTKFYSCTITFLQNLTTHMKKAVAAICPHLISSQHVFECVVALKHVHDN